MTNEGKKFSSYVELTETPKRIYFDSGWILYRKSTKTEPMNWKKTSEKHCLFGELDEHEMNERRHLHDLIEKQVWSNRLQQYVKNQKALIRPKQPPSVANVSGSDQRSRPRMIIL